jgi:2-phospho-L-lactate guanylyltransferase
MHTESRADWVVVLPVKGTRSAKSRLAADADPSLGGVDIPTVSLAFAADTVAACRACAVVADVIVVVADGAASVFDGDRVTVIRDHQRGLNAAIEQGIHAARTLWPGAPVAVLTADLPALTPAVLQTALDEASQFPKTMAADKDAVGTALLTALDATELTPRFGLESARAHVADGHRDLSLPSDSALRLDVDTVADLATARDLGLGPASTAALGY